MNIIKINTRDFSVITLKSKSPLLIEIDNNKYCIKCVLAFFYEPKIKVFEHDIVDICNDRVYSVTEYYIDINDVDYIEIDN